MNASPFFSIVIPLYNKEEYIARAIQSVAKQSFQNFEVLIVNDGSTDKSVESAKQHIDARFRIIEKENGGVSSARNLGINEAKSKYIVFLDADDTWETNLLEIIVSLIEKFPEAALFATGYNILNAYSELIETRNVVSADGNEIFLLTNYFFEAYTGKPPVNSSSVCVKKEVLEQIGGFATGIWFGEDLAIWSQVALKEKIALSSKICSNYYQFGTSNNTNEKFVDYKYHFDFSSLQDIEGVNKNIIVDVSKFVEIYTLRQVALAIRNNDIVAARILLKRVKPNYFKTRYYLLKILSHFPFASITVMTVMKKIIQSRNKNHHHNAF